MHNIRFDLGTLQLKRMTKEETAPKKQAAAKKKTRAKAKPKPRAKAKAKAKAKASPKPPPPALAKANAVPILAPIFVQPVSPVKIIKEQKSSPVKKNASETTKCHIPKKVRTDVWNTFIGPNIPIHKCLCCLKTTICMTDFQVGHVMSEHDGGSLNIDNLRPICASCNISMGTINMKDYVVKFGYLI